MKILILILTFSFIYAQQDVIEKSTIKQDINQEQNIIRDIESFIKNRFLQSYKDYNIQINDISVTPAMDINLNKMKIDKIIFDDRLLKRDSGNFEVHLYHNEKRQRVFFTFNINATIDALSASNNIKTNEVITNNNSQITQIPITKTMQIPALPNILNEYSAKSFIPNGAVIIPSKIMPKILIQKGDIVEVLYNNQNINISFNAKALESGSIGQIIKAENTQSGKIIDIEILNQETAKMK
ncbi:flagella basal body P-ring formation protein FlgA [Helicobacter sp. 16-1353]|uniref:flagellar basal body P-ring formation chaperone FlgA n=1 Tax=Helicobacter sp. 16-1353 TaxID=2004996 RepID=UPI000DCDEF44|nr:flagellar basal body P-ring formation chaperone FlgA [Helicobacter sp. 16-1353]RAX51494.1 flagella basal body P-ring formation protein FlgA [Helicobacter sp. 16-1353]